MTRTALQNAGSIAALMLTTEALVAEIPEPKTGSYHHRTAAAWAACTKLLPNADESPHARARGFLRVRAILALEAAHGDRANVLPPTPCLTCSDRASVIFKDTYMRITTPFRTAMTGTFTVLFPGACEFREEIS